MIPFFNASVLMLKRKSNVRALLRYLYILPVAVITITAFAYPENSHESDKISSAEMSILALETLSEIKVPETSVDILTNVYISLQDSISKESKKGSASIIFESYTEDLSKKVREKVAIEQTKMAKLREQLKQAEEESGRNIQRFIEEQEKNMIISLTKSLAENDDVVIIIDESRVGAEEVAKLEPERIKNTNIHRNRDYTRKFGEDLEGVILIETKEK